MPLDTTILATFALFWLAIVPTPGPNILMVTHVAMTRTPELRRTFMRGLVRQMVATCEWRD